jgi:hypothetical protein
LYHPKPGIKGDLEKFWSLPDRIFFGYGACHILAGAYLERPPLKGFYAEHIKPSEGFWGNHIYVTDGEVAFDFHGYSARKNLLSHHSKGWSARYSDWGCMIESVTFDLLSTAELNQRKMRGPDQYLLDPVMRAREFIARFNHAEASAKAAKTVAPP